MERFFALIVEPDIDARMRLKQTASVLHSFQNLYHVNSLREARNYVELAPQNIDILFVSKRIPHDEMREFFNFCRDKGRAKTAANIVLFQSMTEGSNLISSILELGADGILCEPFSVDQLSEISELAIGVRREKSEVLEKKMLTMLFEDFVKQIDLIACLRSSGCEPGHSAKVLRELGETLSTLPERTKTLFNEICVLKFPEILPPPDELNPNMYGGASERVKKMMSKKNKKKTTHSTGETS